MECVTPATCPGQDDECQQRTCENNTCGVAFAAAGTPVSMQTAGDCQEAQCDGAGGVTSAEDNADIPADSSPCTADLCTAGVPSNPAQPVGTPCGQGGVCDAAGACAPAAVSSVDYPVIAHGARLVITGVGFTGTISVTVGGIAQSAVINSDTQLTVAALGDATPTGVQPLVVTKSTGSTTPFNVTVVRLQISELDSDTPNGDAFEFIEISTGVPGVSLAGYTLVFWNGAGDHSYTARQLNAQTNANGMLVIGSSQVMPSPALTFIPGLLQDGADAVGIYQALPAAFPLNTPVTAAGLIDALVYGAVSAEDQELLNALISTAVLSPARKQVDEAAAGSSPTHSIQRCANGRRHGGRFAVGTPPTPGAANTVMPCP